MTRYSLSSANNVLDFDVIRIVLCVRFECAFRFPMDYEAMIMNDLSLRTLCVHFMMVMASVFETFAGV